MFVNYVKYTLTTIFKKNLILRASFSKTKVEVTDVITTPYSKNISLLNFAVLNRIQSYYMYPLLKIYPPIGILIGNKTVCFRRLAAQPIRKAPTYVYERILFLKRFKTFPTTHCLRDSLCKIAGTMEIF